MFPHKFLSEIIAFTSENDFCPRVSQQQRIGSYDNKKSNIYEFNLNKLQQRQICRSTAQQDYWSKYIGGSWGLYAALFWCCSGDYDAIQG